MIRRPPRSTLFPYTTSSDLAQQEATDHVGEQHQQFQDEPRADRKSTRLNSSHLVISYAVFCLKKKKKEMLDSTESRRVNRLTRRQLLWSSSVSSVAPLGTRFSPSLQRSPRPFFFLMIRAPPGSSPFPFPPPLPS